MKRYIILLVITTLLTNISIAQNVDSLGAYPQLNQRELQIVKQQWVMTDNAAGMVFQNVNKGSYTRLERYLSEGEHHRVQEGSSNKGLRFVSERYDRFNDKVFVRGQFSFSMDKEYDRAWSDVINTYNSNPYYFGSSVRGNYDKQQFDLNLKVYSVAYRGFNFGLTIDYHVADISRQRDPRTRTYMIDYSIIPSIVYNVSDKSKLGFNIYYRYDKERMPSTSTVQTDPNLKYYNFVGLHNAIGRIGGYRAFSRQFISDYVGTALQYNYIDNGVKLLLSAGYDMQWQDTFGSRQESPGSFNSHNFRFLTNLILENSNVLHNAVLSASFKDAGANEYRQTQVIERDTLTGVTTEYWETTYIYKNRYVVNTANVDFSWKSYFLRPNSKEYKYSIGFDAAYRSFSNIYYLPKSEYKVDKLYAGVNGSVFLYNSKDHRVELEGSLKGGFKLDSKLDLFNENEISENILRPDLDYHNRTTVDLYGSVRYSFPMKFVKKGAMSGFAKIYAGNIFAQDSMNWTQYGISIGILTF